MGLFYKKKEYWAKVERLDLAMELKKMLVLNNNLICEQVILARALSAHSVCSLFIMSYWHLTVAGPETSAYSCPGIRGGFGAN
ncbi:hypothetical protein LCGC14_1768320 [marine sediment metagenome]|uniref:Uncharacterized protein n=1 Tax=marine sediment metagenome TaxID=412755 RepID=A0A0F9JYP8_9ZZZZ